MLPDTPRLSQPHRVSIASPLLPTTRPTTVQHFSFVVAHHQALTYARTHVARREPGQLVLESLPALYGGISAQYTPARILSDLDPGLAGGGVRRCLERDPFHP